MIVYLHRAPSGCDIYIELPTDEIASSSKPEGYSSAYWGPIIRRDASERRSWLASLVRMGVFGARRAATACVGIFCVRNELPCGWL